MSNHLNRVRRVVKDNRDTAKTIAKAGQDLAAAEVRATRLRQQLAETEAKIAQLNDDLRYMTQNR
jgi:phage shock protein A